MWLFVKISISGMVQSHSPFLIVVMSYFLMREEVFDVSSAAGLSTSPTIVANF